MYGQLERTRRQVVPKPHAARDCRDELGAFLGIDEREHACGDLRHATRGIGAQSGPGVVRAATGAGAAARVARKYTMAEAISPPVRPTKAPDMIID